MGGLAELGEAEIDGENGLRHAVVKLAADAAALFVLELEEFSGELVDGALGVFEVGDVGESGNDAEDGAVGIELRDGVTENPEKFGGAGTAPTHSGLANGALGAEDGWDWTIGEGNFAALIVEGNHAELLSGAADDLLAGEIEHVDGRLVDEFEGGIGTGEDNPDVKITDECAEALFAFAQGFGGAALLREIGEGDEDVGDFA